MAQPLPSGAQYQQHPPPLLSTASPHHAPPQLRPPASLHCSSSLPAMAVLGSAGSERSPSPSPPAASNPPRRLSSTSSPSPPAAMTSSTPSPLSSSQTSSSSSSSSSSTDRWVRECLIKAVQIILHARLLSPTAEEHLPVSKTFNLHTPEAGITHAEWEERMRGREGEVIQLDVLLSSAASSASPVLLERWRLHHDMEELFALSPLSSSASSRRVDPTIMFKRMLLLCRSLYSYVRLLPAAALAKHAATYIEHDYSPPFTLHYSLHTSAASSSPSFRASTASYSFTPISTPRGQFTLGVLYLADLTFISLPPVKKQLPSEVMEDYMTRVGSAPAGSSVAHAVARRLSVPAMAHPVQRASTVSPVAMATAHPHSLPPSSVTPGRSSRSNSHTHVETYSPQTNTPTFAHGTPPTPSQYPHSLTDTPPFASLPPSPHYVQQISHSHSSPIAIAMAPQPSPKSAASTFAQSPPIAIPSRQSAPSSSDASALRSTGSHSPLPSASLRARAYSQVTQPALEFPSPRQERTASSPPSASASFIRRPTTPVTGLSLLAQHSAAGSSYAPPSPSPSSSSRPMPRDAELALLLSWVRSLPPLLTPQSDDSGGTHAALDELLRQVDVLVVRNEELQRRAGVLHP